jgi:hypothetical protein
MFGSSSYGAKALKAAPLLKVRATSFHGKYTANSFCLASPEAIQCVEGV